MSKREIIVLLAIAIVGGLVPAVMVKALGGNVVESIICGFLLAIVLLLWFYLSFLRSMGRAISRSKLISDELESIPQQNSDDVVWEAWIYQKASLIRGMGFPWKAKVFNDLMQGAQPENRATVAKDVLEGFVNEIRFGNSK